MEILGAVALLLTKLQFPLNSHSPLRCLDDGPDHQPTGDDRRDDQNNVAGSEVPKAFGIRRNRRGLSLKQEREGCGEWIHNRLTTSSITRYYKIKWKCSYTKHRIARACSQITPATLSGALPSDRPAAVSNALFQAAREFGTRQLSSQAANRGKLERRLRPPAGGSCQVVTSLLVRVKNLTKPATPAPRFPRPALLQERPCGCNDRDMSTNPINNPSSNYLQATLGSEMAAKGASPSNRSAAPSNTDQVSFAQMLNASNSSNGTPGQSLTQAMSSFHASGIKDQD